MVLSRRFSVAALVCLLALVPVVSLRAQNNTALDSFMNNAASKSVHQNEEPTKEPAKVDPAYKQEDVKQHSVSPDAWDKATKGLDYSPEGQKKKKKNAKKHDTSSNKEHGANDEDDDAEPSAFNFPFFRGLGVIFQYILYGIMLLVLGVLIVFIFRSTLFLKNTTIKREGVSLLEDLEENLQDSDLDKALREALERRDYRLALRIYYLAILKEMTLKDWIKYKKDKTNYEYVRELGSRPSTPIFRNITYTFELFWYGDNEVGEREYHELSPAFSQFIDQIRRGQHG